MELTKITRDANGNPRYVVHFTNLLTDSETNAGTAGENYATALKRAKQIGGRKYHTKAYGGGIVFQSYNTSDLVRQIKSLTEEQ